MPIEQELMKLVEEMAAKDGKHAPPTAIGNYSHIELGRDHDDCPESDDCENGECEAEAYAVMAIRFGNRTYYIDITAHMDDLWSQANDWINGDIE